MNQKFIVAILVVCFAGSALSQDSLYNMMMLRHLMNPGRGGADAAMAQNTNTLSGAAPGGRASGMSKMLPLMFGANAMDIDPMMMMLFSRGF